jgi:lipopolysaccharide export system protein LptC
VRGTARAGGFHTRLVTVLKIGLPLMAVAMLLSLFLFPGEERVGGGIVFSEADIESLGEGLRISRPVLTGATRDNDPFRFTAETVVPDAAPPARAGIHRLAGTITFVEGQTVQLEAPVAALDFETQVMEATERVTVISSDGYRLSADRMVLDLVAGTLDAEGTVDGEGPMGTITAETMSIVPVEGRTGPRVFSFGNGVRLVYEGADGAGAFEDRGDGRRGAADGADR